MTRKELEKALKGTSEEQIRTLAESVAVASTLGLLKEILQRQNLSRIWTIPAGYATALMGVVVANHEIRILGFQTRPIVFTLQYMVPFAAIYLGVFSQKSFLFGQPIWKNSCQLFVKLARRADQQDCEMLCSLLWELRGSLSPGWEGEMDEVVTPLLLNLDEDEAQELPNEAKNWIRWRLKRSGSPEFRIAGLLTLASSGDTRLASVVKKLGKNSDERVQAAAIEALRIMQENRR